ncbi:MAG TPA: hypothetical protein DHU56_04605 [Marinobacter sp.]|jgi:hypothetical protein|nr:hypothetical protein [Marinobacter sp.]
MARANLLIIAATALLLASGPATAENLDLVLSGLLEGEKATYIGYDSIEREDIPESSSVERKYLIVDYRFDRAPADAQLQASVHKVCMALLGNRELIRNLTAAGYDMVSIAFNRQSQYDCL